MRPFIILDMEDIQKTTLGKNKSTSKLMGHSGGNSAKQGGALPALIKKEQKIIDEAKETITKISKDFDTNYLYSYYLLGKE